MWMPIETAPKDGSIFWCYDKKPSIDYGYDQHRCCWDSGINQFVACEDSCTDIYDISPTHWMPLIDPPRLDLQAMVLLPQSSKSHPQE